MNFRGRSIDPIKLWEGYVDFPPKLGEGAFSPLVLCPNPDHDNTRSPAFQVNLNQPTVHCFSRCGIEGSYEHAICVIHGLYDKHKVGEAKDERNRRERKRSAYRDARKIIFKSSLNS